jgi:hypothetical protein
MYNKFELHDYAHLRQYKIKNMFKDHEELQRLDEEHLLWLENNKAAPARDLTVGNGIQVHKPPVLKQLAHNLYEQMKTYIHPDLILTYWFSTVYGAQDFLQPHSDRPCCSISLSFNVGQVGPDWPIYVWDWNEKSFLEFNTDPGDGVIYSGFNNHHRNVYKGLHYHQLFVHTVLPNTPEATDPDTISTIQAPTSFELEDRTIVRMDTNTGEIL